MVITDFREILFFYEGLNYGIKEYARLVFWIWKVQFTIQIYAVHMVIRYLHILLLLLRFKNKFFRQIELIMIYWVTHPYFFFTPRPEGSLSQHNCPFFYRLVKYSLIAMHGELVNHFSTVFSVQQQLIAFKTLLGMDISFTVKVQTVCL